MFAWPKKALNTGGCLQSFVRDGVTFDTGVHYVGSLDEGQSLYKYFKYFNLIGKLNLKRMDNEAYDVIRFNSENESYNFAMGPENFAKTLSERFPKEKSWYLQLRRKDQADK